MSKKNPVCPIKALTKFVRDQLKFYEREAFGNFQFIEPSPDDFIDMAYWVLHDVMSGVGFTTFYKECSFKTIVEVIRRGIRKRAIKYGVSPPLKRTRPSP